MTIEGASPNKAITLRKIAEFMNTKMIEQYPFILDISYSEYSKVFRVGLTCQGTDLTIRQRARLKKLFGKATGGVYELEKTGSPEYGGYTLTGVIETPGFEYTLNIYSATVCNRIEESKRVEVKELSESEMDYRRKQIAKLTSELVAGSTETVKYEYTCEPVQAANKE